MGVVSLLDAIMGTKVDLKGLEEGLQKAEKMVEEETQKIAGQFGIMGVGIATAIGGAVLVGLEKALKTTAEWGLEMEHLSNRMGVTTREAATLVGVMERFGVNASYGARAMQMLSMQVRQTQESLDPFATRLGKVLGTLRDSGGQSLPMIQVFDMIRQKVAAAGSESDRLRIVTELLGARMGGQLLPMLKLTNEEWERQKASVESTIGPIEKAADQALAFKQATAELEQEFRKLEIEVGTKTLPAVTKLVDAMSASVDYMSKNSVWKWNIFSWASQAGDAYEKISKMREETAATAKEADKLAEASEQTAAEIELTEQNERKIVAAVRERVALEEKAMSLGIGGNLRAAVSEAMAKLEEQRAKLESELSQNLTPDQRLRIEEEITKNKVEGAELVRRANQAIFKQEEEAIKYAKELRFLNIDQEIAYRKQKAAQQIGGGDIFGAAGEIVKIRDLEIKQADEVFELTKKIRVVSLQSEIDYQKEKLQLAKGNAEEEMKILGQIADLDKQLYDKRLEFSLSYTQNVVDQYNKVMDAAKRTGQVETFERAKIDSERNLVEATREAGGVLRGGGTTEQRQAAVQFAQFVNKQIEQMQSMGKEVSGIWRDAAGVAKDILKAASGGEEVRAPGGPSPTIGSLLSPAEGLATEGLARGSDIPRLDTSFTDLAVRVRDVLLGTIPNVQNFSNAVNAAATRIAALTGTPLNPGIVGPGGGTSIVPTQGSGQLATSGQTTGPPTVGPGGVPVTPSVQIGVGSVSASDAAAQLSRLNDALESKFTQLIDALNTTAVANQESLQEALAQVTAARGNSKIEVSIDPSSGDLIVNHLLNELSQ